MLTPAHINNNNAVAERTLTMGREVVVKINGEEKARGKITRIVYSLVTLIEIDGDSETYWLFSDCQFLP